MPRQLTPEERAIIRATEEQGAAEEREAGSRKPGRKMVAGWLMFIGFFIVLFLAASLILSIFN